MHTRVLKPRHGPTLLVRPLEHGDVRTVMAVFEQLSDAWPSYLGYLISFLTIGAAWLGHDAITDRLTRVDSLLLRINLLLLLVIAFLPFPTRLMAEALHDTDGERVVLAWVAVPGVSRGQMNDLTDMVESARFVNSG